MSRLTDSPPLVFLLCLVTLWLLAALSANVFGQHATRAAEARQDLGLVVAACLTLLGLIIGFSFSMAISGFELRRSGEEAEANAIGTEYIRADLLPAADAAHVRELLGSYLGQRILFYNSRDAETLRRLKAQTRQTQAQLWSAVRSAGTAQPNPVVALTVAGMNDVLNAQGNTQPAWQNRIPATAWVLMAVIAILCNVMVGYMAGRLKMRTVLLAVLPLVLSIAFFLIADIDSPRHGLILVPPQNLLSLAAQLQR